MSQTGPERQCPDCGQTLRFPANVGGVVMACPVCGHRFASPFRLAGDTPPTPPSVLRPTPVAPPSPPLTPSPAAPDTPGLTQPAPAPSRALAARVAAIYAKKAS